jgi:hypothetical protein
MIVISPFGAARRTPAKSTEKEAHRKPPGEGAAQPIEYIDRAWLTLRRTAQGALILVDNGAESLPA